MKAVTLIAICLATSGCDNFDVQSSRRDGAYFQSRCKELATFGISGERRDQLVTELSGRSFSEVGVHALHAMCLQKKDEYYGYYNPRSKKPWLEATCPENERIRLAAAAIWNAVIERAEAGSLSEQLAALSLEPSPEEVRMCCLFALYSGHYNEKAKVSLERLARDKTESREIAVTAAMILVKKEDPNDYLPTLLEACDGIENPLSRSEKFRYSTEGLKVDGSLTIANDNLFLNYGFNLLGKIDDGESGKGYFLAMHLGNFIGIPPIRPGQGPFAPDQRLPEYRGEGKNGYRSRFFQDTVDNAVKWWRENRQHYCDNS